MEGFRASHHFSFAILRCNHVIMNLFPFMLFPPTVIEGSKNMSLVQNLKLEAIFQVDVSLPGLVSLYRK